MSRLGPICLVLCLTALGACATNSKPETIAAKAQSSSSGCACTARKDQMKATQKKLKQSNSGFSSE